MTDGFSFGELDDLHARLTRLPAAEPSEMFKSHLLGEVQSELRRQRIGAWWAYVGAVAAALVLWTNLSWITSGATSFAPIPHHSVKQRAATIARILPEIAASEAERQARLIACGRLAEGRSTSSIALPLPAQRRAFRSL